jgi:hypothetical protein
MPMTNVPTSEKILPLLLPSMIEAEKFSDHPRSLKITLSYLTPVVWNEFAKNCVVSITKLYERVC